MNKNYVAISLLLFTFNLLFSQNIDLTVESISWTPENPTNGETVTFTAIIKNAGTDTLIDDFYVEFLVEGSTITGGTGVLVTESINGNNGTIQVQKDWVYSGGDFTVEAIADYGNLIVESGGEDNNSLTEEFVITIDPSDYIVKDISWEPAYQYLDPFNNKTLNIKATIKNQGLGGTVSSSTVDFLIDGVSAYTKGISGLAAGDSIVVTYPRTISTSGDFDIEVIADINDDIDEELEDNNNLSDTFNIDDFGLPDLVVTDISWLPDQPQEGETVTFYAQVENQGTGGTPTDYNVRFTIDGTEVLGEPLVEDAVGFGQIEEPFGNAGFEMNDWSNWTNDGGYTLSYRESQQDSVFAHKSSSISFNRTLQSQNFQVTDNVIGFYMKGSSPPFGFDFYNMVYIRKASDGSTIKQQKAGSSMWQYYSFNMSEYIGEEVYIYVYSRQGQEISLDNFRMGSNPSARLVVSVPTETWTATVGEHTIKAEVDINNTIEEGNEENQVYEEVFSVPKADYVVTDISWEPAYQYLDPFNNKTLNIKATIKNQGLGGTVSSSTVDFLIDGVSAYTKGINGLAAGDSIVVTYPRTISTSGDFDIEVIADINDDIDEELEDNNNLSDTFNIDDFGLPDLVVTDISWLPDQPQEGETVTFYAQVENQGTGGTPTDYNVRFTIDGTEVLGEPLVEDAVGFGQIEEPFGNAGFEMNDWSNWTNDGGYTLSYRESQQDSVFAHKSSSISFNRTLQSQNFQVTDNVIGFYMKGSSPPFGFDFYNMVYIRKASDGSTIKQQKAGSSMWQYYSFNMSEYIGEEVYIYVYSRQGQEISLDNFRMGSNPSARLVVSVPTETWTATVGEHTIKAEVDINNTIEEGNEENQVYEEVFSVPKADYVVTDISWEPAYQYLDPFNNKTLNIKATIKNQGLGGTVSSSTVDFLIDGVSAYTKGINGLAAGDSIVVTYPRTISTSGDFDIEVIADINDDIDEELEDNNNLSDTFNIDDFGLPDLVVTDISWLPDQPQEGETVTFYAQVENQGTGGTPTDYNVRFTIDGTEVLGEPLVEDAVGFGQIEEPFGNAGFEMNDWSNWTNDGGYTLSYRESQQDSVFAHKSSSISFNRTLQSQNFQVTDNVIGFYMKGSSPPFGFDFYNMVYIRKASDGSTIKQQKAGSSMWQYYSFNMSEYIGEEVYIYVYSRQGQEISLDNFRMGSNPSARLVVSVPTETWTATVGEHTIKAEVDYYNDIEEAGEGNNSLVVTQNSSGSLMLNLKVFLEGPYDNLSSALMFDNLRNSDLVPLDTPHTDGLTTTNEALDATGNNAIIDWVWVELRDATDNTVVVKSQSALLQRDGDVVDVDGISSLSFNSDPGNYYVAVVHRNHLGVISANHIYLDTSGTTIDFRSDSNLVDGGTSAIKDMGDGYFAMYAADFDGNGQIQNSDLNGILPLLGTSSYSFADLDMNGQIQNTDINIVLPNLGLGSQVGKYSIEKKPRIIIIAPRR